MCELDVMLTRVVELIALNLRILGGVTSHRLNKFNYPLLRLDSKYLA